MGRETPKAQSPDVLQSLLGKLDRARISVDEVLTTLRLEGGSSGCLSPEAFRAHLGKLGFQLPEAKWQELIANVDQDKEGYILLDKLAARLTRTKSPAGTIPALTLKDVQDGELTASTNREHSESWQPGEDRHGSLTQRERRMNSNRRKQTVTLDPMTTGDVILAKIKGVLNRRKVRTTEIFRFLDTNGNGAVSPEEFARGLQRLGVHKLTGEELNEIMQTLDTDRSGDISLSEFDKALKLAERKAREEGRVELVELWQAPPDLLLDFGTNKYDWSKRTLKFDSRFTGNDDPLASRAVTSRDISQSVDFDALEDSEMVSPSGHPDMNSSRLLNASTNSWLQASTGPLGAAMSAPIGCGSLHDNFIFRQRLVANTWASHPPSLQRDQLPLYRHSRYRRAIAETRWGAEPVGLPDEAMHKTRDGCLSASRPRCLPHLDGGREKFHAPLLKSVIDTVVFGHDIDFSEGKHFDESFKAKFQDAYGRASWFTATEDHGSGVFRQAAV